MFWSSKWILDFYEKIYKDTKDIKELDDIYNSVVLANFIKEYDGKKPEVLPINWLSNIDHEKTNDTYTYHLFAHSWWNDEVVNDYNSKISIKIENKQVNRNAFESTINRLEELKKKILK